MAASRPSTCTSRRRTCAPSAARRWPRGTTLTVRGRPLRAGRAVVLTDGVTDVPFVDDGAGGVVARWTVVETAPARGRRRVRRASVGGVRVRQPEEQEVVSIPDMAPRVTVEGAPRTVRLLDEPSIPIHYEATDDHGLREVDLVLRAGTREERRVLSHPAADVIVDRGGYEVQARDPFFKKAYTPVEITVEARDNNAVSGPKWGKSAAIVVIPPQVGEPEALRYEALLRARDALTDLTALRVTDKRRPAAGAPRRTSRARPTAQATAVKRGARGAHGLVRRARRARPLRGAGARADSAGSPARSTPRRRRPARPGTRSSSTRPKRRCSPSTRASAGSATATPRPSPSASPTSPTRPRPGSLAALGATERGRDGRYPQTPAPGRGRRRRPGARRRRQAAPPARRSGARSRRDRRQRSAPHRPRPRGRRSRTTPSSPPAISPPGCAGPSPRSAAAAGTAAATGAGAAASSRARPRAPSPASRRPPTRRPPPPSASSTRWRASTPSKIGDVEESLERAVSAEDLEQLKQEAKEHADAIREAVKRLPARAARPDSAEAAAAAGREEAEAMAGALEGGRPRNAVESGRRAVEKLAEAERAARAERRLLPRRQGGARGGAARPTSSARWPGPRRRWRSCAAPRPPRAKGDLQRHGKDEQSSRSGPAS